MSGLTDGIQGNLCLSSLHLSSKLYKHSAENVYSLSEFYPSDCNNGQAEEVKAASNLKFGEDGGQRHCVSRLPDL